MKAIEASGLGVKWNGGEEEHGPAYEFTTPDGHRMEILWDVGYHGVTADKRTPLKNRPQKKPARGVPVRRLDHVNLMAASVTANKDFMMNELGFRLREHIVLHDGDEAGKYYWSSTRLEDVSPGLGRDNCALRR